eukprot:CAMPEP_0113671422 /NCGR_PEP_ID=MMETSP0038_2-20120614/5695_1 /TAXON_ID=2898 /ORGANISM="Cryptomonas paramecium" /LENGTH=355 /DNA_ID=CAMNT_0000587571 /DNA_START=517 /DNA_END=1580 /DNA_ORIENTATION=- /assembly_acc=CAM_ASM_000170
MNAEPLFPRESWSSSRPKYQPYRRRGSEADAASPLNEMDLVSGPCSAPPGREYWMPHPGRGGGNAVSGVRGDFSPTSSEFSNDLRCMRAYFSRAMAHIQSNARQPMAKAAARELNCWLMNVLSQPDVRINSQERRALMMNLKRISHLQKENLQLKLKQVVSSSTRSNKQSDSASDGISASGHVGAAHPRLVLRPSNGAASSARSSKNEEANAALEDLMPDHKYPSMFDSHEWLCQFPRDNSSYPDAHAGIADQFMVVQEGFGSRSYMDTGISSLDFDYNLELPQLHKGPLSQQSYMTYRPSHGAMVGSTPSLLHRTPESQTNGYATPPRAEGAQPAMRTNSFSLGGFEQAAAART